MATKLLCRPSAGSATSSNMVGNSEYSLVRKIGSGAFGEIYLARHVDGGDFAVKVESNSAKYPQLRYENKIYKHLQGGTGIPSIKLFVKEAGVKLMVMDLLGPSLEDLFNHCNRKFSLRTILLLVDQMLARLHYCHGKGVIHRDMKPDNFLVGTGENASMVYIIDFGLAKKYVDVKGKHIVFREGKSLTGTARYASINNHMGLEQSRRDDMESLAYIFIYFFRGNLPWQGLKAKDKQAKYEKIAESKLTVSTAKLCEGMPVEFTIFLNHCKNLRFDQDPEHDRMRRTFRELCRRKKVDVSDPEFDWSLMQRRFQRNSGL